MRGGEPRLSGPRTHREASGRNCRVAVSQLARSDALVYA